MKLGVGLLEKGVVSRMWFLVCRSCSLILWHPGAECAFLIAPSDSPCMCRGDRGARTVDIVAGHYSGLCACYKAHMLLALAI